MFYYQIWVCREQETKREVQDGEINQAGDRLASPVHWEIKIHVLALAKAEVKGKTIP